MPLYMFHLRSGKTMSADDTGTEFASLDLAYLDAFRAAGEIWLEMSRDGRDGSRHCFEITDSAGQLLIELPFIEVFRAAPNGRQQIRRVPVKLVAQTAAKSQSLVAEMATLVAAAQQTIQQTHQVLARARPQR